MAIEQAFVTPALSTWRSNLKSIEDLFAGMSDEELLNEFLPGKNRYVYLMGHLAAVHDRMLTLLGIGQRLHPELDQPFLTSKDRASETPPVAEIRKAWVEINAALNAAMEALPAAAWLEKTHVGLGRGLCERASSQPVQRAPESHEPSLVPLRSDGSGAKAGLRPADPRRRRIPD
jgi:hypothetical protein